MCNKLATHKQDVSLPLYSCSLTHECIAGGMNQKRTIRACRMKVNIYMNEGWLMSTFVRTHKQGSPIRYTLINMLGAYYANLAYFI